MAEPAFLVEGTTPKITDPKQRILTKWLGVLQNRPGAFASNNPQIGDTKWKLEQKINKAKAGVP